MAVDDEDEEAEGAGAEQSPEAQALTAAKVQAIAAAGRLVAFQVRTEQHAAARSSLKPFNFNCLHAVECFLLDIAAEL